jgi:ATP/ADP translocase
VRMLVLKRTIGLPLGRYFGSFLYQFGTGVVACAFGILVTDLLAPLGLWEIANIVIPAIAVVIVIAVSYALFARETFKLALETVRKKGRKASKPA